MSLGLSIFLGLDCGDTKVVAAFFTELTSEPIRFLTSAAGNFKYASTFIPGAVHDVLKEIIQGRKHQTKVHRYPQPSAFYNFVMKLANHDFRNPCDSPMCNKTSRAKPPLHWTNIEKETVDEIIFRTSKPRNRLTLEWMARSKMRISAVPQRNCRKNTLISSASTSGCSMAAKCPPRCFTDHLWIL